MNDDENGCILVSWDEIKEEYINTYVILSESSSRDGAESCEDGPIKAGC